MGWNTKLLAGRILRGKSSSERQDEEKDEDEGDPRKQHNCEIKGLHRRGRSWCNDAYNCGDCWYFKKYSPEVCWICCRCLKEQETDGRILTLDYYQSGDCQVCGEETLLLFPAVMEEE
jgi:hypothetical protein